MREVLLFPNILGILPNILGKSLQFRRIFCQKLMKFTYLAYYAQSDMQGTFQYEVT